MSISDRRSTFINYCYYNFVWKSSTEQEHKKNKKNYKKTLKTRKRGECPQAPVIGLYIYGITSWDYLFTFSLVPPLLLFHEEIHPILFCTRLSSRFLIYMERTSQHSQWNRLILESLFRKVLVSCVMYNLTLAII